MKKYKVEYRTPIIMVQYFTVLRDARVYMEARIDEGHRPRLYTWYWFFWA